jgi:hypothetical protein
MLFCCIALLRCWLVLICVAHSYSIMLVVIPPFHCRLLCCMLIGVPSHCWSTFHHIACCSIASLDHIVCCVVTCSVVTYNVVRV